MARQGGTRPRMSLVLRAMKRMHAGMLWSAVVLTALSGTGLAQSVSTAHGPTVPGASRVVANPDDEYQISFNGIPSASSTVGARNFFPARAAVIDWYNACKTLPQGEAGQGFITVALGKLEFARQGGRLPWPKPRYCVKAGSGTLAEVRHALLAQRVRSKVGTSGLEFPGCKRTGEYDVALRGFITMIYRYGAELGPAVRSHILHSLLNQRGPHDPNVEHIRICGIKMPETENHLLQIETSRYLTNQLLFKENRNLRYDNQRNGMTAWMLHHLQRFLQHDFIEYNARPYQFYTTAALQNLYDFAEDSRVKTAAEMVLDYISAKFAVSSNNLRRAVPFRRRKEYKGYTPLFGNEADPNTHRFIVLAGATQRLHDAPAFGRAPWGAQESLQTAAVGTYRVPDMIMDLVVNPAHKAYYQRIHHDSSELFWSDPAFLISAGGYWKPSWHCCDEIVTPTNPYSDTGWALPTTLMPTATGTDRNDFIRFDGAREDHDRNNTCVWPGFACGLNPVIPRSYMIKGCFLNTHRFWLINEGTCGRRLGFYVAVYTQGCQSRRCKHAAGNHGFYGFFEVRDARQLSFADFVRRVQVNFSRRYGSEGNDFYLTSTGNRIYFNPNPPHNVDWGIERTNVATDMSRWPLAEGNIINSAPHTPCSNGQPMGHCGLITIDNPWEHQRLVLDMRNYLYPRRYFTRS